MRNKPGNLVLLILATCVLIDVLIARPSDEGNFLISIGVFGALLSRALLNDPQSVMVSLLGFALALGVVCGNHSIIDPLSGGWLFVTVVFAAVYALWEKIVGWFSM